MFRQNIKCRGKTNRYLKCSWNYQGLQFFYYLSPQDLYVPAQKEISPLFFRVKVRFVPFLPQCTTYFLLFEYWTLFTWNSILYLLSFRFSSWCNSCKFLSNIAVALSLLLLHLLLIDSVSVKQEWKYQYRKSLLLIDKMLMNLNGDLALIWDTYALVVMTRTFMAMSLPFYIIVTYWPAVRRHLNEKITGWDLAIFLSVVSQLCITVSQECLRPL